MAGQPETDRERRHRREVREFIRTAHPDVGGDPAAFAAGLAALRARSTPPFPAPVRITVVRTRGPRAWLRRLLGPRPARRTRPLR